MVSLCCVYFFPFAYYNRTLEDFQQARNFEAQRKIMDNDGFTDPVEYARGLAIKLD